MTLGSGSVYVHVYQRIKATVWFGFKERKRFIGVFGLRSGSVRRPVLNSFRANFIAIVCL